MHILRVILLLVVATSLPFSQTAAQEPSSDAVRADQTRSQDLGALHTRIDSIRQANHAPAAQVAVILPDTTVLWNFGTERSGAPVTDSTLFRAGSISKSFAGLSMLMLAERGQVSLDAPLAELAPELPIRNPWRATHPVRLSHLLEAGAGFADRESVVGSTTGVDLQESIAALPYRLDVQWRPGEYTAYHNLGPVITAHLVEKISGRPYEEFVRENLFEPLRMTRASYFLTPAVVTRLADTTAYEHIGWHWPSGALNTSAGELAALVRMLLNRGTYEGRRLLSPESVERFETPTSTLAARKLGVGLGHAVNNWTTRFRGVRYHGHGGLITGYEAYYAYSPERGTGFVYMGQGGPSDELLHYPVMEAVLSHLHPATDLPPARPATTEEQRTLAGCYVLANPESLGTSLGRVRVEAEDGMLWLVDPEAEGSPRWTLEPDAQPGVFRVRGERPLRRGRPDEALVTFVTDEDGTLVMQHLEYPHEAFVRTPCR